MADTAKRPVSTVYVGGLDTAFVTSTTLSEAFIPFGEIADISLPKPEAPSSTELHRGFGYVEFEEADDAKEAIENMDQSELFGRIIKVAMAKPEKKNEAGALGSKTAIWEQEGYLPEHPVNDDDTKQVQQARVGDVVRPDDPMEGLEGLDVAGPKPQ